LPGAIRAEERRDAPVADFERHPLEHEDDVVVDDFHVVERQHSRAPEGGQRPPSDFMPPFPCREGYLAAAALMCLATTSGYAEYQWVTLSNLPPCTGQIWPSPPPSWSAGVTLSGGTSPPRVKLVIFSKPAFVSTPVIFPAGLALSALRMASTWSAAMRTPRL